MKTKKCSGCGVKLQTDDASKDGFIESSLFDSVSLCRRCFRIKHYNEYQATVRSNHEYAKILEGISNDRDLVVYVVDIFNMTRELEFIFKYINNPVLLVITKRDIMPRSVKDEKVINNIKTDKFIDTIMVSADKNYHIDRLYKMINGYKMTKNVYVVGKTNAGKSTLINKFIRNYSVGADDIVTSPLPSTTLDLIKIKMDEGLTIIDTPGLIDDTDIINFLSVVEIKKITPKKEVKPKTFQVKGNTSIIVEPYLRVDSTADNSFTFYAANSLIVKKNNYKNDKLKTLKKHILEVEAESDIVINGLLWIKVVKAATIIIYTLDGVLVYTRKNII